MILPKSLCYKVCEPNSATWAAWSEATLDVQSFGGNYWFLDIWVFVLNIYLNHRVFSCSLSSFNLYNNPII